VLFIRQPFPTFVVSKQRLRMKSTSFFKFQAWIIAAVCCCLCACEGPKPENRYDKIATGFCECTSQLVALNKGAIALAADTSGNAALVFKQMEAEYNNARACSATILLQYGRLKKEEFAEVEKAMQGKCPDLALQKDLLREMLGE
jgi:hypothetical protein